jgi:YYY domain-containing protein
VATFLRRTVWQVPALIGLTLILYLPYIRTYVRGYSSFRLWEGQTTPVTIYLWIYGALLLPVATRIVVTIVERERGAGIPRSLAGGVVGAAVLIGAALVLLEVSVTVVAVPIAAGATLLFFLPAGSDPDGGDAQAGAQPGWSERLLWMVVTGAMLLSLVVEVLVLEGDIQRMNTVFKFYLQVWILLSVAAAVSLVWLWSRVRSWSSAWRTLWVGTAALMIAGGLLFLPLGVRARAIDRMAPETGLTLNGMAFVEHAEVHDGPEGRMEEIPLSGDYHAIRWMQEHTEGSPVILEGLGRREYLWANRVSIYTGLPTVVGWRWHEVQQRAGVGGDLVDWRREDVRIFYTTTSTTKAREILERYGVRYVYVGAYERAYYPSGRLKKLDTMVNEGTLRVVYEARGVAIYEVVS